MCCWRGQSQEVQRKRHLETGRWSVSAAPGQHVVTTAQSSRAHQSQDNTEPQTGSHSDLTGSTEGGRGDTAASTGRKLKVCSLKLLTINDSLFLWLDHPQVLINPEKRSRSRTSELGLKYLGAVGEDEILKKTRLRCSATSNVWCQRLHSSKLFGSGPLWTGLWGQNQNFETKLDHLVVVSK